MLVGPAILFVSLKGMPNIGSSYNMKHIKLLYEKKITILTVQSTGLSEKRCTCFVVGGRVTGCFARTSF